MPALIEDLTIEQGADFQREYTITNLDGSEIPNFPNINVVGQLRDIHSNLIFDLDITVTGSKTILLWIKYGESELLNIYKQHYYKFDIEGTLPNGIRYRLVDARVTSKQEQTKTTIV